ncbi:MAG: ATP-dependent helicase [Chloroflexi bacterium]|nr:ATP-dependent helicase [Chloroflexota bacterium]
MRPRIRSAREPSALDQAPLWAGFDLAEAPGPVVDPPAGLDALLGGLNPDQLRAVTHGTGPLLIVAGAGTGKTQVITRRIAWLVATRRAKPGEVLGLTFTDKAAEEMAARVDQLVPYGYADTSISTFHAFGDRLIREFALELGLPTDVRVLSRAEVVIFLREHLFDFELDEYRPLGDPTRFLAALASLFSRCKDEDVSPARYLEHATRLTASAAAMPEGEDAEAAREAARRQLEIARAYGRYQALLGGAGFIDFGDQVALVLRLLRTSPAAREAVRARYRYILVDEFQDTNRAQSELVALLAERHRNVTVVGDDDQSIYRFRGAAISNILEFRERYRGAKTVVLRRNYRSLAPILDAAYRLVRFNDPDRLEVHAGIVKELLPERSAPAAPPVRHEAFATAAEEADWIAAEIRRRVDGGARPRDHAVLVRANADADPVLRSLNMAGLPWRFSGTSGLYARPEVRLLLSFLRVVADPTSSLDLYALASSGVYRVGGEDLTTIMVSARRRNRSPWEVLGEVADGSAPFRVADETRRQVAQLVGDVERSVARAHERPAGEVLYGFLRESGILGQLAGEDSASAEEALANIARFFEIVRTQSALLADDRAIFLARHLRTLIDAGDDPATADLDADADAVAVLTVHKAKGLEFPVVFLPGLVAGRFPVAARRETLGLPVELVQETLPEGDFQLQEERRLFYVAMTRARDGLVLSHAADYGGNRARRVSPFVLEALDVPLAATGAWTASPPLERLAAFEPQAPVATPPVEPVTGPLMLSYYAIDDYLTCPLKFRFGHVLRVPTAPHHSLVYGAALHSAVQQFHRRQARGDLMTQADLNAAFEAAWTNDGFLSREHEAARLEAGRAALHRFREAQLEPGAVVPAWVEREFSFSLGGDRIRGRMDRVDIEPADGSAPASVELALAAASACADVIEPTLELMGRERVTITDYKSSDVRDPVRARQRTRESLQLQIYAMAYEAMTGRLPDAVQLHFLDSGLVSRVEVDPKRLEKARSRIATAAAGIRARDYRPSPSPLACTYCPFREICPSSAAR